MEHLIIIAIITFALGILVSFLFTKANSVNRSLYDKIKEELLHARNESNTKHILLSQVKNEATKLEERLHIESQTNRMQETKIADLNAKYSSMIETAQREREINNKQQIEIQSHQDQIQLLDRNLATFKAQNQTLVEKLDTQKQEILEMANTNRLQFQEIAEKLLRDKSTEFTDVNQKNIEQILNPLKEKIKLFEEKIESTNKESIARHSTLKELINTVSKQSEQVAADANNLAKALKGDFKKQGNWGELILQSILDKSGLEKDREYFLQESLRSDDGKLLKPDVVIHLPDNKRLIIDSKVSLVAYDAMTSAETTEEAEKHARNHTLAVKQHINGLADKNYHDLYQIESPDFVLMFIPIETAFSAALHNDRGLYEYAFNKNIVIVTPSTLLASLKTIESLWKNDKQNRFALEIAKEAGKMYDKFVGFVEDLDKMGKQLHTVQNTYNDSMKKLSQGTGNLMRRAEKIKELGANASKSLPINSIK